MADQTALVTGINGFTGPYVAEALQQQGYKVVGLGNSVSVEGHVQADLLDKQSLIEAVNSVSPDIVVHLAAISFAAHDDNSALYQTNVVGTTNLLEALQTAAKQPGKVLLASSANVYGNGDTPILNEQSNLYPANHYAVSKVAMEYAARMFLPELPIIFARPFNYTGVNQNERFLVPKIVSHFRRGERQIELGNIDVYRDFSDVRDVARAYCTMLSKGQVGEVYNVCSGVEHSLSDIISMLTEIAGYDIDVQVNPEFVRENEVKKLLGDRSKLDNLFPSGELIQLRSTLEWMMSA
jgi:nucleoside-diphosphate-sugar epimerase